MKQRIASLFPDSEGWTTFWSSLEFGREGAALWLLGFLVLLLAATWLYRRDTRELPTFWKVWLWSLRCAALIVLLLVALAPQERTSRTVADRSQVVLLVDTSISMNRQDREPPPERAERQAPTRAERVHRLLEASPLLKALRQTHDLSISTFDSQLARQALLPALAKALAGGSAAGRQETAAAVASDGGPAVNWSEVLRPRGAETRLGEALAQVVREEARETLAGIVVFTDGGNNAGIDPMSASDAAVAAKVRVIPVGVGNTNKPVTLQLAEIQAPTHVHIGDGFTLTAFIGGHGLAHQPLTVELLSRPEQDDVEPVVVESREVQILEDGVPVVAAFDYVPTEAGRRMFRVRVRPAHKVPGLIDDVAQDEVGVDIVDRKTRVLLLAGGPMRDYQFVRNLLNRDKTITLDVLLQTAVAGVSQESDDLLFAFPSDRESLFRYDVIVAFDPDWRKIAGEEGRTLDLLAEWVFAQAGGLVLVSGDVNTPLLASAVEGARNDLGRLLELFPVVLDRQRLIDDEELQQPWPIELSRDGLAAGFLQLSDDPAASAGAWRDFPGIFRCFPTDGAKAGATVYARFGDPRGGDDRAILLASQFYGAGRVLYLGSAEMWRLRSIDENYYDRLWIRLLREAGQGRLLRGTNRGIMLLERSQYSLGATIQVRTRVLDPQFKDYVADKLPLEVFDPKGRALTPPPVLLADKTRPGQYAGSFVALAPGTYKMELAIPESADRLKASVSVRLPNLEFDHPEQHEALLRAIARPETGGVYLRLDEAAEQLPALLPDRSTQRIEYSVPRPLWDRQWIIFLLAGLLSLEWLTRKLLKLA
ncbi:MAG: VWA domain-containing protein [Planctomycetaceae bacterium]